MSRLQAGAEMFRDAATSEAKRLAVRVWLTDVLQWAQSEGEDTGPAFALLGALEGLDFGHVDPMLRLPAGQKGGGKEPPPAEVGINAFAIAAIDALKIAGVGVKAATQIVADDLNLKPQSVENLRKKMSIERSKPPTERKMHRHLIEAYEAEMRRMQGMSEMMVRLHLFQVSKLMGVE